MAKNDYVDKLTNYLNANLEGDFIYQHMPRKYRVVSYMGPSRCPPSKSVEESIKAVRQVLPIASQDKLCAIELGNIRDTDNFVEWTNDIRWVFMDKKLSDNTYKFTIDPFEAIDELPLG